MKIVEVPIPGREYQVHIGPGLMAGAGELLREKFPGAGRVALITDDSVNAIHAPALERALERAGYELSKFVLPHGEAGKNGENYLAILSFLARSGLGRSDVLAALGGGMVGDIAAFAAATYMRGIAYVHFPTTLLAMVDSSVGGKTAIDLPEGKNLAGAFCQPGAVIIDTDTLASLPRDFFRDGCAEVLKYGVLGDGELFGQLRERGLDFDREEVIFRCVSMKRDYVCADEFDTGLRRKLNLGHTLGHALEKLSGFALSHGQCVAVGTACVARAAGAEGLMPREEAEEICLALASLGLPTLCENGIDELIPLMLSDKKRLGSHVNLIVPQGIGRCGIVPMDELRLREFMSKGLA